MLSNDRGSTTLGEKLIKKESKKSIFKRLKKYKWGMGIEHEMQLFHKPKPDDIKNKNIGSYIMFNAQPRVEELLKSDILTLNEREFLQTIPFEPTGRKCHGKIVLPKTPIAMPEFITSKPFSSLTTGKRTIEYHYEEIRDLEDWFIELLHKNNKVIKLEEKYGLLDQYPFGMTNYLKYSTKDRENYKFAKDKKGKDKLYTDYLGSYHITLTLPFTDNTKLNNFIKMHQNYANQIQWLEPLLVTAFFSSDQSAVGTTEKRIKGSYRVTSIGWGNFGGSDIRKFSKGIGRYANIKAYWRDNFDFYNSKKTKYCEKLAPGLKKIEPGAITGYSSNFRTFGSTDPLRPWHRESGIGMTKPNGVELRIFDHFDSLYLGELCKLVIYVAENSRVHKTNEYVYKNKYWIEALRRIMLHGWNAELPEEYIKLLRKNLGLKINTKSIIAYDILYSINEELFKLHKKGDWIYLMMKEEYKTAPKLPKINRFSWETGLMLKLNKNAKLMEKFNKFVKSIPHKEINLDNLKKKFYNYFDKKNWKNDIIDIIYFLESLKFVQLKYKINGKINSIKIIKNNIRKINNFNNELRQEWNRPFLEEYYNLIMKTSKSKK